MTTQLNKNSIRRHYKWKFSFVLQLFTVQNLPACGRKTEKNKEIA
jgi:hypothetical protein